jgi:Ferritin-like domain
MDTPIRRGRTRRELVRDGLAVGVTASACAGVELLSPGRAQAAAVPTDAELLVPLIGNELLAAFGYQQVLASQLLSPRGDRLAQRVLDQEQEHITTLSRELTRRGGSPPAPISSVSEADTVLTAHQVPITLANLHTEHDAILLLSRFELMLEGAYIHAIKQFRSPRLLRLGGQIIANEGQHGVMLSELLHPGEVDKAVPSSNVLGTGS